MKLQVLFINSFLVRYDIDEYVSLIWTERYASAGDVQLVLLPNKLYLDTLKPGTFLSIPESKEVMIIETQLIENGLLKISGRSLLTILNQRYVWELGPSTGTDTNTYPMDYKDSTSTPGEFIFHVVSRFAINGPRYPSYAHTLDVAQEWIPNLSGGNVDTSGVTNELVAPLGPIYDAVKPIAESYDVGMSLYLEYANTDGSYSIRFTTYKGKDRTSNQTANSLMRLSPLFDEISDVKELQSNVEEINRVYVWGGSGLGRFEVVNGVVTYNPPTTANLDRRVKVIHPAITPELFRQGIGIYKDFQFPLMGGMYQTAKYFLSRHKPIHIVDAEVLDLQNYRFGYNYGLGDIIEYESAITGELANARVTEYIRSHDSSGEKAYPTIVIE